MSTTKFTLRLYGIKYKDITPNGGLSLSDISEIVGALSDAIELGDIKCTINEIHNEAYNIVIATDDERGYNNYVDLWKNIDRSNGHLLLRESQAPFGNVISKFTKKGVGFAGLDDKENLIAKIEKVITEGLPKYFYEIDDVYGRIIEIGGKNENKTHIRVKQLNGETILIYTTPEQDESIYKFYKKVDNIYFSVRFKINFLDHTIIESELDGYSIPNNYKLHESANLVSEKYPDLFGSYDPTLRIIENRR